MYLLFDNFIYTHRMHFVHIYPLIFKPRPSNLPTPSNFVSFLQSRESHLCWSFAHRCGHIHWSMVNAAVVTTSWKWTHVPWKSSTVMTAQVTQVGRFCVYYILLFIYVNKWLNYILKLSWKCYLGIKTY